MTTPRDNDALQIRKWAATGDAVTPESVGITRAEGWDLQYSTPGGKLPEREVINQVLREISALGDEVNRHGCGLPWDERISYLYPALVMGSDGKLYLSLQNSTGQNPTAAQSQYWQAISDAVPAASETAAGVLEVATTTELNDGLPLNRSATAGNLAASNYRRIHLSDNAPQSSDGVDGDVWLEY